MDTRAWFACLALCALGVVGCSNNTNPAGPSPTGSAIVLWRNGVAGTWFGNSLVLGGGCGASTVTMTDNITGDTNVLLYSATNQGYSSVLSLSSSAAANPSSYYAAGHLQFDIELATANTNNLDLEFEDSAQTSWPFVDTVPPSSLSSSTFTHESIPLASFSCGGCPTGLSTAINLPFMLTWSQGNAGACAANVYLNDIQWTSN